MQRSGTGRDQAEVAATAAAAAVVVEGMACRSGRVVGELMVMGFESGLEEGGDA